MKYRSRIYYTEKQKALMWERWREKGEDCLRPTGPGSAAPAAGE